MSITSPVSLAAGMIKSAPHLLDSKNHGLLGLMNTITFGSFTLEPREGNQEPVFWFNEETDGSINAVGLANQGLQRFLERDLRMLMHIVDREEMRLGVSLAPLAVGHLSIMFDWILSYRGTDRLSHIEVNAACPNHRGEYGLSPVLAHDAEAVERLVGEIPDGIMRKFTMLKIAPETPHDTLDDIVTICLKAELGGIVSGNTKRGSSIIDGKQRLSVDSGGHAGLPLLEPAVRQAEKLREIIDYLDARDRLRIIGCGGVMNADGLRQYQQIEGTDEVQIATLFYQFGARGVQDLLTELHNS